MNGSSNDVHTWLKRFEQQVLATFGFLGSDYGFAHTSSLVAGGMQWQIKLRNDTTGVEVSFETGTGPWVMLSRDGEEYGLGYLVEERTGAAVVARRIDNIDDPALQPALSRLAEQLQTYATDILRGDFSIFPKLRARAEARAREASRHLYREENS